MLDRRLPKGGGPPLTTQLNPSLIVSTKVLVTDAGTLEDLADGRNVYDVTGVRNPSTKTRNIRYRLAASPGWKATLQSSGTKTIVRVWSLLRSFCSRNSPAKKKTTPRRVATNLRPLAWQRDGKRYVYCESCVSLDEAHIDHIVSCKRGTNSLIHLRTLCRRCPVATTQSSTLRCPRDSRLSDLHFAYFPVVRLGRHQAWRTITGDQ